MFTFRQWKEFCEEVISHQNDRASFSRADELLIDNSLSPKIVIKHDVEANIDLAKKTAEIESDLGIRSTYYVHSFFLDSKDDADTLRYIQSLGHEIGYHYDVLDIYDGNYDEAEKAFANDLKRFEREGIKVSTICPHGNPLKKRDGWNSNKDFFKDSSIRSRFSHLFDIVNDIKVTKYENNSYISDAGYQLKLIGNVRDNDKKGVLGDKVIGKEELLDILNSSELTIISVHTHRLSNKYLDLFFKKKLFFTARIVATKLRRVPVFSLLMNKMFTLSKRF
ncbi:hypothetical protein FCL40_17895 [Ferrimonas sediminicola]|uniref:Polysaccharide deacetylase n=1 Tax=Ferrimonas sediminicola TaxID=2569538 RepID=A0A4U1B7A2_9GAMM|nr:hypothetical protein [Ferrimonas sediminicola]TKB46466.1 hypothetical protein FCL40_17895 [Ferrimonas sediminicola]